MAAVIKYGLDPACTEPSTFQGGRHLSHLRLYGVLHDLSSPWVRTQATSRRR